MRASFVDDEPRSFASSELMNFMMTSPSFRTPPAESEPLRSLRPAPSPSPAAEHHPTGPDAPHRANRKPRLTQTPTCRGDPGPLPCAASEHIRRIAHVTLVSQHGRLVSMFPQVLFPARDRSMTPSTNGLATREKPSSPTSTSSPSEARSSANGSRARALSSRRPSNSPGRPRSTRPAGRPCRRAGGTRSCRCCRNGRSARARSARPWRTASSADADGRTWCRRARPGRTPAASRRPGTRRFGFAGRGRRRPAAPPCASRRPAGPPPRTPPGRPRRPRHRRPGSGRPAPRDRAGSAAASAVARLPRRLRQDAVVDLLEDARQRHAPALVARPGRGIERRALDEPRLGDLGRARQRARRQVGQRLVLGRDQGRDHAQEAFQLVARRQRPQPLGAAREDRREIGQADGIALGDLAQGGFAEAGGRIVRAAAQGLPTSWRNHLRWCFQLQPRVTEPRVMARSVPLTQMAA